jgi:hypothetical protein
LAERCGATKNGVTKKVWQKSFATSMIAHQFRLRRQMSSHDTDDGMTTALRNVGVHAFCQALALSCTALHCPVFSLSIFGTMTPAHVDIDRRTRSSA